jgi:hypothetical protein
VVVSIVRHPPQPHKTDSVTIGCMQILSVFSGTVLPRSEARRQVLLHSDSEIHFLGPFAIVIPHAS